MLKDIKHNVLFYLKSLDFLRKSLKEALESLNPRILGHFLPTNWEKNQLN